MSSPYSRVTERLSVLAAEPIAAGQIVDYSTGLVATTFSPTIAVAMFDAAAGEEVTLAKAGEVPVLIEGGIRFTGTSAAEYAFDADSPDLYLGVGTNGAAVNNGATADSSFATLAQGQWAAPLTEGVIPQKVTVVIL